VERAAQAKAFAHLLENGDFMCATPYHICSSTPCGRYHWAGAKRIFILMAVLKYFVKK